MRELALAGAGIASLPDLLVREELARGHLVEVLPAWRPVALGVYAVWPANSQRAHLTQRCIDFLHPRIESLFSGGNLNSQITSRGFPRKRGTGS
jgi:DNA-binding transcriptional LysR family regulator